MNKRPVIIVGAGLAGLCLARNLSERGIPIVLLDAKDRVGGRVRTDIVEGFRLDRGFQVFLTSYPEARRVLDYEALQLRRFNPGALIRFRGRLYRLTDPWRKPLTAISTACSPIGSFFDKLRIARLRSRCLRGSLQDQFDEPETTTLQALENQGFSRGMIDRFFRPFLGGIFLDPTLQTSSRMFSFAFRMFSQGDACLPADGMEAIPQQLAQELPHADIRLGAQVEQVEESGVRLASGERLEAQAVVVAVEGAAAANLLQNSSPQGSTINSASQGTTCLYFAAPKPPLHEPYLVLNGEGTGPINSLCVPTLSAPSYGLRDESLVSVTVFGIRSDEELLRQEVCQQLTQWFGDGVQQWRHLRTYAIPDALPNQYPPALHMPERPVRLRSGIYVCGDHRDSASIQGAMVSGRCAAEAFWEDHQ